MNENNWQQDHTNPGSYNECDPSLEDDSSEFEDEDTCTAEELNKLFKHKYKIHDETAVAYDNSYVLSLAKDDSFTCIAAGLSDGSVRLFETNSVRGVYIKSPSEIPSTNICGLRFVDETPNLLLIGTTNGLVRLLDLRTRTEVARFVNTPEIKYEPRKILSFDRNASSRLLVMGTAMANDNVNLLFYDFRNSNLLFKYCQSHQDDLISVRFHPDNYKLLLSGSAEGLINIFDVTANDEDDAILTTINTESTVYKVNWNKNKKGDDIVACITNTNGFKAYTVDADLVAGFNMLQITEAIKRKTESCCNLINSHNTAKNDLILVSGLKNGPVLRSSKLQDGKLLPYANFVGNNQVVRESIFDAKTNILITAGEGGFVTLWTSLLDHSATLCTTSTSLKMKSKKSNKVTPY